jgi:hypothetical protein
MRAFMGFFRRATKRLSVAGENAPAEADAEFPLR